MVKVFFDCCCCQMLRSALPVSKSGDDFEGKKGVSSEDDIRGQPLFLTKLVESGEIEKARRLSRTGPLPNAAAGTELLSHSGFFTVNKEYNSNIFFWFFPALNQDKNAPLLLWLQGGPGGNGFFGSFVEHGPYVLGADMTARLRDRTWAETFQVLYVDNPVGSGFSFTDDVRGYVTNQEEMAEDMYEFLKQFFKVFDEYGNNDFYITGQSFGGKYVPSLAYKIHTMGPSSGINLRGMAIGNGMCDPESMMDYGTYLYNIGLVDELQADQMRNLSAQIVSDIRNSKYYEALIGMQKLIIDFQVLPNGSLFKTFTGFDYYYNFLEDETPRGLEYFLEYVHLPELKRALNVGTSAFQDGSMAQKAMLLDIMRSAKSEIAVVMDNYRVLFYNGQLDVIIPYPLTVNFLKSVDWKRAGDYRTAERKKWILRRNGKEECAGYYHQVGDFFEVLVRNAGHVVPYDQPEFAFDLISRFVTGKSLS